MNWLSLTELDKTVVLNWLDRDMDYWYQETKQGLSLKTLQTSKEQWNTTENFRVSQVVQW